jgi:hypothetical protein
MIIILIIAALVEATMLMERAEEEVHLVQVGMVRTLE